jgi:hypothetical protein
MNIYYMVTISPHFVVVDNLKELAPACGTCVRYLYLVLPASSAYYFAYLLSIGYHAMDTGSTRMILPCILYQQTN